MAGFKFSAGVGLLGLAARSLAVPAPINSDPTTTFSPPKLTGGFGPFTNVSSGGPWVGPTAIGPTGINTGTSHGPYPGPTGINNGTSHGPYPGPTGINNGTSHGPYPGPTTIITTITSDGPNPTTIITTITSPGLYPGPTGISNVTSHGSYTGPPPTTTGALSTTVLAPSIPALPPAPDASSYPSDGQLHAPQPAPYTPAGGVGTNGSAPLYRVLSDFDYQSIALALHQEWIELDLFHWGLAQFSAEEFEKAGLTAEDRHLIEFMADQEVGHATLLSNILGPSAPKQCTYNYPATNVHEFIDFAQKLTRYGEAGVYGFLNHLNAHDVGQLLLQSITTEARQQMIFRQFEGLFPMPEWFEVGIPQSWAWSLLAPYISSCPENNTRLVWQNYPALTILNQPNPFRINGSNGWNETADGGYTNTALYQDVDESDDCTKSTDVGVSCAPGITRNRSIPLSYPGRRVFLEWDAPGQPIGPNNSYVTDTQAGAPKFAAWVSQLNVTYSPLENIQGNSASTVQPDVSTVYGNPAINGTIFLALTDEELYVTPYNLTQLNPHVYAVGMYQSG